MKVKGVLTRLKGTFKSHMLARAYLLFKTGMVPVDQLFDREHTCKSGPTKRKFVVTVMF